MQHDSLRYTPSIEHIPWETHEYLLGPIDSAVSPSTPGQFFRLLSRRLAETAGVRSAVVAENLDDTTGKYRLLALWTGSRFREDEEFEFGDVTAQTELNSEFFQISLGRLAGTSAPAWLSELRAETCVGITFLSDHGQPIGWVAILDSRPLPDIDAILPMLRIFGARAAIELDRIRLIKRLAASEERYRRLVESSPDVIYRIRLHPEVRFEHINPAAERVFGYPMDTFRAADRDFILGMLTNDEDRADASNIADGKTFYPTRVRRWRRGDGTTIWTEQHSIPIYDETGRLVAQEGTVRDVTAREDALRALNEGADWQRRLMGALPDLMLRLDEEANFLELIPTAYGQMTDKAIEHMLHALAPEDGLSAVRKAARTGTVQTYRSRIELDGERSFEFRFVPMLSGDVLALVRDVTAQVWMAGEDDRRRARERIEGTVERQIGIHNPYHFTFREFTVLQLLAGGAPDKEIANELGIALSTVNKHVSNILGKMDVGSRTEASVRAVQEGLVAR